MAIYMLWFSMTLAVENHAQNAFTNIDAHKYYAHLVFETLNVYLRLPSEYSCVDFEHITFSLMRNILYILYKMDLVVFVRY